MFLKFQYCINYWGFDADILQLDEMGFELSDKAEDDRYIRMLTSKYRYFSLHTTYQKEFHLFQIIKEINNDLGKKFKIHIPFI